MNIVGDGQQGQLNQGQQAANPLSNVNIKDADDIKCEKCECEVFEEKIKIKKISKFMTGSEKDSIMPIPVIVCAKCNHINEMFKPNV